MIWPMKPVAPVRNNFTVSPSTFVQLVLGDAHLEMTLGYKIPNIEARFKRQIEQAIQAAPR
jgi:TetR/AcrR family transcriptional repressor of mexJK operon